MPHEANRIGWNRRQLLALAASAAAIGPLGAQAQTRTHFATRPVRVVVPFAAGGATDVIARVLGERMAQRFGQSVVVDNKPGAAGLIAGDAVVKSQPADTPAQNLQEFMAWIQTQKGRLSYGSYGIGSHGQLACTTLSEVASADMTHVAYKGEAPMVQDMLGGQVRIGMGSMVNLKPHIDAGKLRALAVTGPRRVPLLPDVPTFTEAGYTQDALSIVGWLAIAGPKGMPADVARQWAAVANHAVASREGMARIIAAGFVPVDDDTPEKFARLWAQEAPVWGRLLQAAGVQPS